MQFEEAFLYRGAQNLVGLIRMTEKILITQITVAITMIISYRMTTVYTYGDSGLVTWVTLRVD